MTSTTSTQATTTTTIRVNQRVKAAVLRQARRDHLSFSDVIRVLLLAYAKGEITIDVIARMKRK